MNKILILFLSLAVSLNLVGQIPQIVLNVNKTLNINPEGFDFFLTNAPILTVSDFNALKKDPDSEIQRLDVEIENQENKIAEFKKVSDQLLLKPYTELKNSHKVLNSKIKVLNDIDSINRSIRYNIANYKASQKDLENYSILKSIKLFTNVTTDKKANQFIEKLRKFYGVSNRLLFSENQIYEYTKGLRIETLELVELNEKDLKKYKKLQVNQSFKIIEDQKKVIKKLTGLDSNYFELIDEVSKVDEEYSSNLEEFLEMKSNYDYLNEAYKNLYDSKIDELQLLDDKKDELRLLRKTYSGKKQFLESKKKYPTIKCGDIMISKVFLREKVFRTGEPIQKARTENEWKKFDKSKTPCYAYKDFNDENNSILYYNIHAITDSRRISPSGFKILEFRDIMGPNDSYRVVAHVPVTELFYNSDFNYDHLKSLDFSFDKINQCERKEDETVRCNKCLSWTDLQRKYNVCSKCNGNRYYKTGRTITCSTCNGKGYYKYKSSDDILIPLLHNRNRLEFDSDDNAGGVVYALNTGGYYQHVSLIYSHYHNWPCEPRPINRDYGSDDIRRGQMFPILICEENFKTNLPQPKNKDLSIGGVEFMSKLLDVVVFNNGDAIKLIEDPVEWEIAIRDGVPAYCYFENDTTKRGCIYNRHAYNDPRGILPEGWRLSEYWDEDYYRQGYQGYNPVEKLTIPRVNFNNYPNLYPHGIRTNDGEFISSEVYMKTIEVWKSNSTYTNNIVPQLNFALRLNGRLGMFYFDKSPYVYNQRRAGYIPDSGYVMLCRDVKE